MPRRYVAAIIAALILVAGCAGPEGPGKKQVIGGLGGAALGGLLGAQFGSGAGKLAATGAGVLIGGLVGSEIGRSMDEVDRMKANEAVNKAHTAPLGETITWNNPDSGNSGTVMPVRDGTTDSDRYCREFMQSITIDGKSRTGYGVACEDEDGRWRILQR